MDLLSFMGKAPERIEGFFCGDLAEKHPPNLHVPGRETSEIMVIIEFRGRDGEKPGTIKSCFCGIFAVNIRQISTRGAEQRYKIR